MQNKITLHIFFSFFRRYHASIIHVAIGIKRIEIYSAKNEWHKEYGSAFVLDQERKENRISLHNHK